MDLLRLSNVELRQICYFLAVVGHENNISKAAEYLQIEQPPLSQRVRSLEKMLKVELFDRKRRPLQLTEAGKAFLREAQLALTYIDRAIAQARRADRGEIGQLSVGIASSITNTVLPDILRTFRDRCPDVELELRELNAHQQVQELRDRRLDIGFEAISSLDECDSSIAVLPIVQESLMVALPETHPLAAQPHISLKALAKESLIVPSLDAFPAYKVFIQYCEQAGLQPNLVQNAKATWMLTNLSLVVAGIGVAILPSSVQNLQRRGVVYRDIQNMDLIIQISALWRRDHSSTVLREFLSTVEEVTSVRIGTRG